MEVMLAAVVFGFAAVALVGSIQQMGKLSLRSRVETDVMRQLQTRIEENVRHPFIKESTKTSEPDEFGVIYQTSIMPAELRNVEGHDLAQLYQVHVRAQWKVGQETRTREARTLRYALLYR